jgi:hypothetical protein
MVKTQKEHPKAAEKVSNLQKVDNKSKRIDKLAKEDKVKL